MRNVLGRFRPMNPVERGSTSPVFGVPLQQHLVAGALALVVAVGGQLTGPDSVAAQDRQDREVACRCVDADGNAIENCTCFRRPDVELPRAMSLFFDQRPRLGVTVDVSRDQDRDIAGARVVDVLDDGPAAEAGIREGDVITHIDGRSLSEPIGADRERDFDLDGSVPAQRLLALARDLEPGQSVEVAYVRDGRQQTTVVEADDLGDRWVQRLEGRLPEWNQADMRDRLRRLGDEARVWSFRGEPGTDVFLRQDRPDGDVRVFQGGPGGLRAFGGPGSAFVFGGGLGRGLGLVEVNPGLGEYFGTDRGVLVTDVDGNSLLGLEAGDIVLSVDGREVTTPKRLRRILASYSDDEQAELRVLRHGQEITVTAPMR